MTIVIASKIAAPAFQNKTNHFLFYSPPAGWTTQESLIVKKISRKSCIKFTKKKKTLRVKRNNHNIEQQKYSYVWRLTSDTLLNEAVQERKACGEHFPPKHNKNKHKRREWDNERYELQGKVKNYDNRQTNPNEKNITNSCWKRWQSNVHSINRIHWKLVYAFSLFLFSFFFSCRFVFFGIYSVAFSILFSSATYWLLCMPLLQFNTVFRVYRTGLVRFGRVLEKFSVILWKKTSNQNINSCLPATAATPPNTNDICEGKG